MISIRLFIFTCVLLSQEGCDLLRTWQLKLVFTDEQLLIETGCGIFTLHTPLMADISQKLRCSGSLTGISRRRWLHDRREIGIANRV